ncbi:succinylglutamate desuccinylase/aspartoacylase domain-containing protein [Microvirga antarctica]|uniref:succinylglutamate desuccinylase/aspartoacylase domain-containing protein n=1 Tax=Microvirga antarctica TaxID=2819233 RepID=UPI001B317BAC|nr:succinylglutamate desuccinylase/aspartoacylase family protein [Microvirga antarctica]
MDSGRWQSLTVGSAVLQPGRMTIGALPLAHQIDGPVAAPVMIAAGARPGPILWVQAAIHGGEVGGTLGLTRCLHALDLESMSGAIVGVLAANPLAFRAQTRNTPQDGENMNRLFPGTLDGSITRQMAFRLMEAAHATADIVVDLHSGGAEAVVPFYSIFWDDGSDASLASGRYARAAATDVVWAARDSWLSCAMFTRLTALGVPSLIVECGGGGETPDADIDRFAQAVRGVAHAAGILADGAPAPSQYRTIGTCDLAFTRAGGFFMPSVGAGDLIEDGGVVGRVVDVFGREVEVITSPKRAFVAAIGKRFYPVDTGAMVAELNDDHGWSDGR